MHRPAVLAVLAVCFVTTPSSLFGQAIAPEFEEAPEQVGADWRLTWESVPGASYRLERSIDLRTWIPVDTVQADAASTTLLDLGTTKAPQVFWRIVPLGDSGVVPGAGSAIPPPILLTPFEDLGDDQWRVIWTSVPGITYTLERSYDMFLWDEVGTVDAIADLTSLIDDQVAAGAVRVFWRVGAHVDGSGDPLVVGEPFVSYQLSATNPSITYNVVAGGTETVTSVTFFDGTVPVGNAQRGFGDVWTLTRDWDPALPEPLHLRAEATTAQGSTELQSAAGVLLADPGRFVPIDPAGLPRYGELVTVDATGGLGAFRYYPEGFSDADRTTGVLFEFAPGAEVQSPGGLPEISFGSGKFFPGPGGVAVEVAGTAPRSLSLAELTPAAVGSAFDLPAGPIALHWGSGEVSWDSGALGNGGWAELQIELPIGDFGFPDSRLNATVGADPESGELFLVICYFGEWTPGAGGPTLRIPEADPLKIYFSKSAQLSAHGTAEAEFPNGAVVRGTLSWRYPNFEFRFEGKGIVIPALDSLVALLPDDPLSGVPDGDASSELDAYAKHLQSYRNAFRGLAQGGATQADALASEAVPALPIPTDAVGAALEAWAGRLASWEADRAGQVLTESQATDLSEVVSQAKQTAAGAHDLPTALKLHRDVLVIKASLPSTLPAGAAGTALQNAVAAAEAGTTATMTRLIAEAPSFEDRAEFARIVRLFQEIDRTVAVAPATQPGAPAAGQAPSTSAPLFVIIERKNTELFPPFEIVPGDISGAFTHGPGGNPHLHALDLPAQLGFLRDTIDFFTLVSVAYDIARADQSELSHPIEEALTQLRTPLLAAHNQAMAEAISSADYHAMRTRVLERTRIIADYQYAGLPLSPGAFAPNNIQMLTGYEAALTKWLPGVDPGVRGDQYHDNLRILLELNEVMNDEVLEALIARRWLDLSSFNKRFLNERLQLGCDGFLDELTGRGFVLPRLAGNHETSHAIRLTGKYESDTGARPFQNLQINQAGRYLVGWLQRHREGRFRLRGLLLDERPDEIDFAILRIVDGGPNDGKIVGDGILSARIVGGKPQLELLETTGGSSTTVFFQNSNYPSYSAQSEQFFPPDLAELVRSHQRAPLHSQQLRLLQPMINQTRQHIFSYASAPTDSFKVAQAGNINTMIGQMLDLVDPEAIPLLRLHFLQELSKLPLITLGDVTRTHRNWFMIALLSHPAELMAEDNDPNDGVDTRGKARILMGDSVIGGGTGQQYHYALKVTTLGVTAEAGIGLGAFALDIEIRKFGPGKDPKADPEVEPDEIFTFDGWLAQAGMGPGIAAGITGTQDKDIITSAFDYHQADLEGGITSTAVSASAAGGTGFTISEATLTMYGNRRLPPMVWNTGDVQDPNFTLGISLGAGVEVAGGLMVGTNNVDSPDDLRISTEIRNFSPTTQAEFDASFDFEFASADLSDCGRQYLRELVADHRAIFAHPGARVAVMGFTDTTASDSLNQALSEARANAVREALREILGPHSPRLPDDRIVAIGLGERPAKEGFPLSAENLPSGHWLLDVPEEYRNTVLEFGFVGPIIPDDTNEPAWRTAIIAVNGLVSVRMKATLSN